MLRRGLISNVINHPIKNMSNPVKEFLKEHKPSKSHAEKWLRDQADAIGLAYEKAGDELSSSLQRGKNFYKTVQKRVGKEVNDADVMMHHNPYPTILIGMLASSVIGYLVACRVNSYSDGRERLDE
jgi:ElaB/YqjD/DUF883 family membrane-anchored ribosome-binding protein